MKQFVRVEAANIKFLIFDESLIKERLENLFEEMDKDLEQRFNEVEAFLKPKLAKTLKYEEVKKRFEEAFKKEMLNRAIQMALTEARYNLLDNLSDVLSRGNMKQALLGRTMIDAFSASIINHINPEEVVIVGSIIALMEKEFLGKKTNNN